VLQFFTKKIICTQISTHFIILNYCNLSNFVSKLALSQKGPKTVLLTYSIYFLITKSALLHPISSLKVFWPAEARDKYTQKIKPQTPDGQSCSQMCLAKITLFYMLTPSDKVINMLSALISLKMA